MADIWFHPSLFVLPIISQTVPVILGKMHRAILILEWRGKTYIPLTSSRLQELVPVPHFLVSPRNISILCYLCFSTHSVFFCVSGAHVLNLLVFCLFACIFFGCSAMTSLGHSRFVNGCVCLHLQLTFVRSRRSVLDRSPGTLSAMWRTQQLDWTTLTALSSCMAQSFALNRSVWQVHTVY